MEKCRGYHPGTDKYDYQRQPFVVERDVWLVQKRERLSRHVQRFVKRVVKRCHGGSGDDDLADEKYEHGHLYETIETK